MFPFICCHFPKNFADLDRWTWSWSSSDVLFLRVSSFSPSSPFFHFSQIKRNVFLLVFWLSNSGTWLDLTFKTLLHFIYSWGILCAVLSLHAITLHHRFINNESTFSCVLLYSLFLLVPRSAWRPLRGQFGINQAKISRIHDSTASRTQLSNQVSGIWRLACRRIFSWNITSGHQGKQEEGWALTPHPASKWCIRDVEQLSIWKLY